MIDIQNGVENRGISLNYVGVSDYKIPVYMCEQPVVAKIKFGVSLDGNRKGIHMSRLCVLLSDLNNINNSEIERLLVSAKNVLQSKFSKIEIDTGLFLSKKAPVSKLLSKVFYDVRIVAEQNYGEIDIIHKLTIPVTSLCPCSKAISMYGAHNQRGDISVELRNIDTYDYPKIIQLIEKSASSAELFEILKRPDEKFVTELAFDNPKFVEDAVRDAVVVLQNAFSEKLISVEAVNYESIHVHNAFAYTKI